jgi:hypothetical protein
MVDSAGSIANIRPIVDVEHLDGSQRHCLEPQHVGEEDAETLCEVDGHVVEQDLDQVVPHTPPLLHSTHDGSKVVVSKHHLSRFLRHICASDAHSNTNVSSRKRGRVVDAVARH